MCSVYVPPPDPPNLLQFRAYIYHLACPCPSFFLFRSFTFGRLLSVFLRIVWLALYTEDSLPML